MSYYPNIFGPFEPNFNRLNNNIPPRYIPTHHRFEALSNPGSFTSIPTASFFRDSDVHDQWNDARVIPIVKEAEYRNRPSGYVDIPIEFSTNERLKSPRHSPRKHNRSPEHRTPKSPISSQRSFSSDRSPPKHFNKGLSPTRNKPKFGQVREIPIITTTQASNFSDKRSVQTRSPKKSTPEESEQTSSKNILEDHAHTAGNVISNPQKTDIPIVREQSKKPNDKNKTQTKHQAKNQRQKSTSPNRGNMKENEDIKNIPTDDKNKTNGINQAETVMEDEKSEAPPPSPPKPSPQEIVEEINNRLATEIEPALESFQGDKCCKEYLYLDEALTKCLLTLDGIDSGGDPNIRQMRRDAVHKVNDYVSKLEGKVQLTASSKKTDDKMETKPNDKSEAKKDQDKDENTEMEES